MFSYRYSCGMPLQEESLNELTPNYCKYCTNEQGNLSLKDQVMKGIAKWLRSWQLNLDEIQALSRAAICLHEINTRPAKSAICSQLIRFTQRVSSRGQSNYPRHVLNQQFAGRFLVPRLIPVSRGYVYFPVLCDDCKDFSPKKQRWPSVNCC